MKPNVPPAIAAFFHAHNSGETENFETLFTQDAVVSDEKHEYRETGIKTWIDEAISKYRPSAEIIAVEHVGERTVVTAQVSGTFPGSPVEIRYGFTLKNDKIAALHIE